MDLARECCLVGLEGVVDIHAPLDGHYVGDHAGKGLGLLVGDEGDVLVALQQHDVSNHAGEGLGLFGACLCLAKDGRCVGNHAVCVCLQLSLRLRNVCNHGGKVSAGIILDLGSVSDHTCHIVGVLEARVWFTGNGVGDHRAYVHIWLASATNGVGDHTWELLEVVVVLRCRVAEVGDVGGGEM